MTLKKNAKTGFSSSREYGQRPIYYMASIAEKNANSTEIANLTVVPGTLCSDLGTSCQSIRCWRILHFPWSGCSDEEVPKQRKRKGRSVYQRRYCRRRHRPPPDRTLPSWRSDSPAVRARGVVSGARATATATTVVGGGALRRRPANSAYGPARCDKRTGEDQS
jgi:hypothetical protein